MHKCCISAKGGKNAPSKESLTSRSVGFVYLHLYELRLWQAKIWIWFLKAVLLSLLHFMLIKSNSSGLARYSLSAKKLKQ